MNYEAIILESGEKIAQLSIDNAILLARVQDEMTKKEAVEKQYMDLLTRQKAVDVSKEEKIHE